MLNNIKNKLKLKEFKDIEGNLLEDNEDFINIINSLEKLIYSLESRQINDYLFIRDEYPSNSYFSLNLNVGKTRSLFRSLTKIIDKIPNKNNNRIKYAE